MSLINIEFTHGKLVEPTIDFKFELDGVCDLSYILLNHSKEDFTNFVHDKFGKILDEKKEQSYGHATNEICGYNTAILNAMFEAKIFKDSLVDNISVENAYKQVRNEAYESLLKLLVLHHKIYDINVKKI